MSIQVSINPSVHEMEAARVRVEIYRTTPFAAVAIADLTLHAYGAEDIAVLAATLHRLGDELAGILAAIEVPA